MIVATCAVVRDARSGDAVPPGLPAPHRGGVVDLLAQAGVDELVDVRFTPSSRKPGLSKSKLAAALDAAGIGYRHEKVLGVPPAARQPFRGGNIAQGIAAYEARVEADAAPALERLLVDAASRSIAVMCLEHDASRCHRQVLIARARERGIVVTVL